jgi:hypothetical protein
MALIKCAECRRDISDKASACPFCGNPVGDKPVTIQRTKKRWKGITLISILTIVFGMIFAGADHSMGISFIFLGITGLIVSRIGAWWTNG